MMAKFVYALCALTSVLCALLLLRGYLKSKSNALLTAFVCFGLLGLNNVLLFVDLVMTPQIDLAMVRLVINLSAAISLLIGMLSTL